METEVGFRLTYVGLACCRHNVCMYPKWGVLALMVMSRLAAVPRTAPQGARCQDWFQPVALITDQN